MSGPVGSWRSKVLSSTLLLVGVAVGVHVAAELLRPLLPLLLTLAALLALYAWVLRRR